MLKVELKDYLKNLKEEELFEILYFVIFKHKLVENKILDEYFEVENFIKYLVQKERIFYKNKQLVTFEDFWGFMNLEYRDVYFFKFFSFCGTGYGVTKAQIIKDLFVYFINSFEEEDFFNKFFELVNNKGFYFSDFDKAINDMHSSSISANKRSVYEMVIEHNFVLTLNTNVLHKNLKLRLSDYNELIEEIDLVECLLDVEDEVTRLAVLKIKEKLNDILYK